MCGIVGFWDFAKDKTVVFSEHHIKRMLSTIMHRGPDDHGIWVDGPLGLAFGHCRLSIVDTSRTGHQPMTSRSKRLIIIYNGEVYNAAPLKQELITRGYSFVGTSDTEVILEAIECFGLENACKKFIGMFAFALWDRELQKLFLVRDRMGVKPLYWGIINNVLFFGSMLKSFFLHPAWKAKTNYNAVAEYLRVNYIPGEMTVFADMHKLEPGTILSISLTKELCFTKFWQLPNIMPTSENFNFQDQQSQLLNLLHDAVKLRLVADVPIGTFLSGGIDSSLVTAIMQEQSMQPINSFSIGFYNNEYNEAHHALQVAKHLHTNHREFYVAAQDACNIIPDIPKFFDEPFADSSQIPTMLVSMMAAQHVKVVLSGDGGDELFAGYNRYIFTHKMRHILHIPYGMRNIASTILSLIPDTAWESLGNKFTQQSILNVIFHKIPKFNHKILQTKEIVDLYFNIIAQWQNIQKILNVEVISDRELWAMPNNQRGLIGSMQYLDLKNYLPGDILTKVDRSSMAYGLEAREPLLDHRLLEFSATLPNKYKIRNYQGKWFLRQLAYKYIPRELLDRPKVGFGAPIHLWLKNELREWAEDLLSVKKLQEANLLPDLIRKRWHEHLNSVHDWQHCLWSILMLQSWREYWRITD